MKQATLAPHLLREVKRQRLISLAWVLIFGIAVIGLWWWLGSIQKVWQATFNPSDALNKNPLLAATRLLENHHYKVELAPLLNESLAQDSVKGTLLIANNDGVMSAMQSQQLLAWVGRGNTLISFPKIKRSKALPNEKTQTPAASSSDDNSDNSPSDETDEDEEGEGEEG
ncbi:MAG: DUF4350 domain-containing protein, partial [Undibacterium sp.]|nr:DUF4350 domain-containing protein [Undibacterium sp.]